MIRIVLFLFAIIGMTVWGSQAQAAGTVGPNKTLTLHSALDPRLPDGTSEDCFRFRLPVCQTDQTGDRLGTRALAVRSFARSKAEVSSYYDFKVDDKDGEFDTVLNAQISGNGEFNGFLAIAAGGLASGSVKVTLLDLGPLDGPGTDPAQVIYEKTLSSHELNGKVTTGINFGIKIEGGAPYIGAGAGPELKFNVQLQKKVIRDGINFGMQALVRRGHKYRIRFDVTSVAKRAATNGTSISQFKLGGPVTDILGTEEWLQGVRETIAAGLPNLSAKSMRIHKGLDWFENRRMATAESVDDEGNSTEIGGSTDYLLNYAAAAGLPTSFQDIVEKRFRQSLPDVLEEGIDRPGFRLNELLVSVEPDHVEIAKDQTDRINEAIRLLLTPQGQRSSDFVECDGPGNSQSNGNTNGNGNGVGNSDGCSFPGSPGSSSNAPGASLSTSSSGLASNAAAGAANTSASLSPSGGGSGAIAWLMLVALGIGALVNRKS